MGRKPKASGVLKDVTGVGAVASATLTLPWPPSVNAYWRAVRGRVIRTSRAVRYMQDVGAAVLLARSPRVRGRLAVEVDAHPPPDGRRHDIDNLMKALLDSLQAAHVIEDDEHIDDLRVVRRGARPGGEVVVRIRTLEG